MPSFCNPDITQEEAELRGILGAMENDLQELPPRREVVIDLLLEWNARLPDGARVAVHQAKESELLSVMINQAGLIPDLCTALYELAKAETHYQRKLSFLTTSTLNAMLQRGDMGVAH